MAEDMLILCHKQITQARNHSGTDSKIGSELAGSKKLSLLHPYESISTNHPFVQPCNQTHS